MNPREEDHFETLESAHDFVTLLAETVAQAKDELKGDVQKESAAKSMLCCANAAGDTTGMPSILPHSVLTAHCSR